MKSTEPLVENEYFQTGHMMSNTMPVMHWRQSKKRIEEDTFTIEHWDL